jgi:hypothetical protein
MRLRELFESASEDELKAQILTVLEFLRNRDHNKKRLPDHTTSGVINMINNIIGYNALTYELFDTMKNDNADIGNLITNMDRDHISLKSFGDEPGAPQEPTDTGTTGGAKDPTSIVNAMAKKAAANRS